MKRCLDQAPFDLNDPRTFVPGCGPGCASDSSLVASLFDFEGGKKECGRCLNTGCFFKRAALARKIQFDELTQGEDLPVVRTRYRRGADLLQVGDKRIRVEDISYKGLGHPTAKPTPGSFKVLHVGENDELTVGYLPKSRPGSGGSVKKPKAAGVRLAERKQILQGKRLLLVHGDLKKALAEAEHAACTEDLIDLVAVFGLPYEARDWYCDEPWKQFDGRKKAGFPLQAEARGYVPEYSRRKPKAKGLDKSRAAALWHGLKIVLGNIMSPPNRVGDVHKRENCMKRVAKLISFPFDAKKKEADLKILPPRTWGKVDPHTLEPIKAAGSSVAAIQKVVDKAVAKIKAEAKKPAKKKSVITAVGRAKLAAVMRARWAARRRDAGVREKSSKK